MSERICINCRYFQDITENNKREMCLHDRAIRGGVRKLERHSCEAMIAGICLNNELFELKAESLGAEQARLANINAPEVGGMGMSMDYLGIANAVQQAHIEQLEQTGVLPKNWRKHIAQRRAVEVEDLQDVQFVDDAEKAAFGSAEWHAAKAEAEL